uniref:Zinc finger and BTB domaincontaining protein 6like [Acyrthosiphon pisum] n=1 Tax=Lepeophtheirus salmonis TaxID=72036 RepID=A0A0K2UXN1_LEPSM
MITLLIDKIINPLFIFMYVGRNSLVSGQCPHCGNEYTNFSSLKYHVRLIHSEASNTLCCYLCPSSFVGRASYKEHLISIHGVKHQ